MKKLSLLLLSIILLFSNPIYADNNNNSNTSYEKGYGNETRTPITDAEIEQDNYDNTFKKKPKDSNFIDCIKTFFTNLFSTDNK